MRILVVEDDSSVASALEAVLAQHGFDVTLAHTGAQALERLTATPELTLLDLVLLDLGLPDRDGFDVCGRIRTMSQIPLIVVTARSDARSRIHGLNIGADDYLVKPYDVGELLARIHALARRMPRSAPPGVTAGGALVCGDIRVDPDARSVQVGRQPVVLTRKEFDVLLMLMRTPGVVVRREQILSAVWGTDWASAGRTLEVHIASVRHKLNRSGAIETVRGIGYRFTGPGV